MPTLQTVAIYSGIFTVVITAIGFGYQPGANTKASSAFAGDTHALRDNTSVDKITALQVAGKIANRADLPVAANIANLSISVEAKNSIAQNDSAAITKPQIVAPAAYSRLVVDYTTKDGETIQSVADQFNVTPQTIKWANDLNTDIVSPGSKLKVLPLDGVLYSIKDGDTVESIAQKYKSDAGQIIAFNDLELSGVKVGESIVLPNGELPTQERPGYDVPSSMSGSYSRTTSTAGLVNGYSSITMTAAGNAYAFGNCTSWAYERRVQLGHPVGSYWGNAATWDSLGRAAGYAVDKTPTVGAVFQMPAFVDAYTGVYGHVGIVESVNPDGSVYVSEMNYGGNFNRVTYRTIPAGQAALYNYIH
jgi:surface antigen